MRNSRTISSRNKMLILYIFIFELEFQFQIRVLFYIDIQILSWNYTLKHLKVGLVYLRLKNPDLFYKVVGMSWGRGEIYRVQNRLQFKRDCVYYLFAVVRFSPVQCKVIEYNRCTLKSYHSDIGFKL